MSQFVDVDGSADPAALVSYLDRAAAGLRELKQVALAALDSVTGQRILDIGCGAGHHLLKLAALGAHPVGLDASAVMTREAGNRCGPSAAVVRGDAAALPIGAGSFDGCCTERVLQHLVDLDSAVAEIGRVLRPGGRLVALETQWSSAQLTTGDPEVAGIVASCVPLGFRQPDILTDLPAALRANGFHQLVTVADTLHTSLAELTAFSAPRAMDRAVALGLASASTVAGWWVAAQAADGPDAALVDRVVISAVRN